MQFFLEIVSISNLDDFYTSLPVIVLFRDVQGDAKDHTDSSRYIRSDFTKHEKLNNSTQNFNSRYHNWSSKHFFLSTVLSGNLFIFGFDVSQSYLFNHQTKSGKRPTHISKYFPVAVDDSNSDQSLLINNLWITNYWSITLDQWLLINNYGSIIMHE